MRVLNALSLVNSNNPSLSASESTNGIDVRIKGGFSRPHPDLVPLVRVLTQNAIRLVEHVQDPSHHSTQSATNTLVLRVRPLFLFELNASFLPSGENMEAVKGFVKGVICSSPVPSRLTMKMLNGNRPVT